MASLRTKFRSMFGLSITGLLAACSIALWLLARYLAGTQAEALLEQDLNRLATQIAWQPQLGAYELRASGSALQHLLLADYWQVIDPEGRIVWHSSNWDGYRGPLDLDRAAHKPLLTVPTPKGDAQMTAMVRRLVLDRTVSPQTVSEIPEAILQKVQEYRPGGEVVSTAVRFEDNRLRYEIIQAHGEELHGVELDEDGYVIGETPYRARTLPPIVSNTFQTHFPNARVEKFDWRAGQGRVEFIVTAVNPDGSKFKQVINSAGKMIALYFPPEDSEGPTTFTLLVADELRWRQGLMSKLAWLLLLVCCAGGLAAWLLSIWLAERALKPMGDIARKARSIDEKKLSERLTGGRPDDEVGLLVGAINGMLDRIEAGFERQRRFARDASHELRSPLTGLIAQLELARNGLAPGSPGLASLEQAMERGQRLRDLVEKLLLLARQDASQAITMRDDVDLRECVEHVVTDFNDPQRSRIQLTCATNGHPETDMFVRGNDELLHAMFRNLIDNGLKFSSGPVRVAITPERETIAVDVVDFGPGIPAAARQQVFEAFVRLHDANVTGSGLGLSIVQWIAKLHHAVVSIDSADGQIGTRFTVRLPRTAAAPAE